MKEGQMGDNLTTKILRRHLVAGSLGAGADITVDVDQVLIEDATGTMCAMQFEMLGVDAIAVDTAVVYIDHNVLQIDDKNMQDHRYLKTFSEKYGIHYSPAGHGISHYIHLERFGAPGRLLVGADSHTSMGGALGMFAIGAGGLEVAVAMAGFGFDFVCPRVIGVRLSGRLSGAAEAKDVVLELLRRYGVRGGRGAVFEFFGDGVTDLPIAARGTICNMVVETGASTGLFPSDDQTRRWLTRQGRAAEFIELASDADASYDEIVEIDLDRVVPLIALPHSPGDVIPVREIEPTEIVQVCVGSSVNSSYDDLATVASILDGRSVWPGVQLTVTPGSRQILDTIVTAGIYATLMKAGARMLEPICGPCVGIGQAPIKESASLRTFNRNFPGRSGTAEDSVYLCSPSTAAASALAGRIVDATELLPTQTAPTPEPEPDLDFHRRNIAAPLSVDRRAAVQIERGANLVPPPAPRALPDRIDTRVLIVVGDDISTGDMAPDGTIAMSVWSNIAACAPFMFQRLDPDFHSRAREWGGGVIVGGENYGQGSSREHAALIPSFLGVQVIAAVSYARIHRRNLLAVGIAPLLLPPGSPAIRVGDAWTIENLAETVAAGGGSVSCRTPSGHIELRLELTPAERATLLAGGLLAQVRGGERHSVADRGESTAKERLHT
jgi:aconitate hydratase